MLPRASSQKENSTAIALLRQLFPANVTESWTTVRGAPDALPLSDSTLHPHHSTSTKYCYVEAYGKDALKAHYPKGSYKPSAFPPGGFSFYAPGPASVDLSAAKEVTFGYSVMFPAGFDFVMGGKLPGIYGGDSDEAAVGCSGGRQDASCFSARLMWREGGQGELYTYLPPYTDSRFAANEKQCEQPKSYCNPAYGASVGRGSFAFTCGEWTTVTQVVKLNTPGEADGVLQLFVGGKKVVHVDGLMLRDSGQGRMRGLEMQTFFGGSSEDWATPKDQDVLFADFSVGVVSVL
ncbi:hypothetical protein LshimejAT787_0311940 [Lyophyllum shimeji]|uniref:Polysaccharide lyase 14 domain-containing protein n=1 Tax=Lyophyllum shimeji TaxID=47721 RepID=A0A9P3PIP3_LYOSH|nr:hypothetical protein LshimejAT787_0311940 [Lyophyllum shimeji]